MFCKRKRDEGGEREGLKDARIYGVSEKFGEKFLSYPLF